jgi:hypothetical protein
MLLRLLAVTLLFGTVCTVQAPGGQPLPSKS